MSRINQGPHDRKDRLENAASMHHCLHTVAGTSKAPLQEPIVIDDLGWSFDGTVEIHDLTLPSPDDTKQEKEESGEEEVLVSEMAHLMAEEGKAIQGGRG